MPNKFLSEGDLSELSLFNPMFDDLAVFAPSHFASRTLKLERGLYVIRERNLPNKAE